MNGIKLIAFDLDGTFLADDKSIPEENLRALRYAESKGVLCVPATGRLLCGVPEEITGLEFIRYYMLINGCRVYDSYGDRDIYSAEIPLDLALRFYAYADTIPCIYDCYIDNMGRMSRSMYENMAEFFPDLNYLNQMKKLRVPVDELKKSITEEGKDIQKMQLFFKDMNERQLQIEKLPTMFPDLIFSTSLVSNIEINYKTAGKGKALLAICRETGISPEETLAFGDGTNDVEMIEIAGIGVVMSNGDEEAKKKADIIAGNNNAAGVAEMIYKLI